MLFLYIYNNYRRKTPLITMGYSDEAYEYYTKAHPDWKVVIKYESINA